MRESGILISGVLAAVAGVMGVVWLALTGLAWHEGLLKPTSSYDASEVGIGVGAMALFWLVGAVLLLLVVVSSLRQVRVEPARAPYFQRLAWMVPFAVVVLVAALWPAILAPGGATFAP